MEGRGGGVIAGWRLYERGDGDSELAWGSGPGAMAEAALLKVQLQGAPHLRVTGKGVGGGGTNVCFAILPCSHSHLS